MGRGYQAAIDDFSKAIEINPNFVEAYFNRGLAYGDWVRTNRRLLTTRKLSNLPLSCVSVQSPA